MMSTCLTCVLALILALCRGQCPERCSCYGTVVRCENAKLSTIPLSLPNATKLNLHNNNIASLPEDAFKGWPNLTELILNNNKLSSIPKDAFKGVPNLEILHLTSNQIRNISRTAFKGLTQLRSLSLAANYLETIDDDVFEEVPNLRELFLTFNQIRNISRTAFKGLTQLRVLDLTLNQIRNISRTAFKGLTQLTLLSLGGNRLESIDAGVFEGVQTIIILYLLENPLICDCQLLLLIEKLQGHQSELYLTGQCSQPAYMSGRNIANVTRADLNCSTPTNDINECAPVPCKNGATCTNLQNAYSCTCSSGWQGNNCDQEASSTSVNINIGLWAVCVLVAITVAVIVFIKKRRRQYTGSTPMAAVTNTGPSQGSVCISTNNALPPIPGALSIDEDLNAGSTFCGEIVVIN